MPAQRPRAAFEPIPPDFDLNTFVESSDNFQFVDRISRTALVSQGDYKFEKLVLLHVIIGGKPLVIDGYEEVLDPWTFTASWLRDNHGDKVENARNLTNKENIPLTIKHYLSHMSKLTEQFFDSPDRYKEKNRQRIYLKDIDCPPVWESKLKEHIPQSLFYLNDSTGEVGEAGAINDSAGRPGRGIGRAGDLMSSLPQEMRAENLMCYIGHEGTYTPSHREMCASLGQNIMVNASDKVSEDGKPTRPGSSLWFMTEMKDRHAVSEYWLQKLGHDIEVENHFAQLMAWKKAPFKTYVVDQRPGDLILIPPLAPHQVWNRGTRTMKVAWNRTTVETLKMALGEALPNSRVVCRDEQYKCKSIVYFTLLKYSDLLRTAKAQFEAGGEMASLIQSSSKINQVQVDFKELFELFKSILLSEMFALGSNEHCEYLQYDSNVTCSYCRCNIFNRFLSCKTCKNVFNSEMDEPYDICMECFCMGRSCACQSGFTWVEQWKWKDLIAQYEIWRRQISEDLPAAESDTPHLSLAEERRYISKKTLAQVCQEQLQSRPFVDITKPRPVEEDDDDEPMVDEYGRLKKVKKSREWLENHKTCHFCFHRHPKWKMATCSYCDLGYCYGTLFRAHDLMPLSVMEQVSWKCPHCSRVCNTGACRKDPRQHPYEPKGTLLGHDTKKVADPRSVECLVDFSQSNLNFMREEEGMAQNAMQRRLQQAEMDKNVDPSLDRRYLAEYEPDQRGSLAYSPVGDSNGAYDANGFGSDDDQDNVIPRLGQKRGRDDDDDDEFSSARRDRAKKKKQKKKDPAPTPPPKNVPGAQYQKEVKKKMLEDARRADRSMLMEARLKGKSKIVKLGLHPDHLYRIQQRPTLARVPAEHQEGISRAEEDTGGQSILQSDIIPKADATAPAPGKPKDATTYRVRIEADETYSTRKRGPDTGGPASARRPRASGTMVEEVIIDSGEDSSNDEEYEVSRPRQKRASEWLARRNEGGETSLQELPQDWTEGRARPQHERERDATRAARPKPAPKPKPKAGIRPIGRPAKKANSFTAINVMPTEEDAPHEDDDLTSDPIALAQRAMESAQEQERLQKEKEERERERVRVAAKEAQENLRAKMALYPPSDDEGGLMDSFLGAGEEDDISDDQHPIATISGHVPAPTAAAHGPPPATNSLLNQPGMQGKKIKITAATRHGDEGSSRAVSRRGGMTPQAVMVPALSRKSRAVDISDSDSDGDVPASAPVTKKPGRSSMVPTRGAGSVARRGRGRPRKTM